MHSIISSFASKNVSFWVFLKMEGMKERRKGSEYLSSVIQNP